MATLLFVHGTGVRADAYAATLGLIRNGVARHLPAVRVEGCFWGGSEGTTLRAGGKSIPGYGDTGGGPPTEEDEILALWTLLYTDPWYELRLLRNVPLVAPPLGQRSPAELLREAVENFAPSGSLREAACVASLSRQLDEALAALRRAPELRQAAATAPPDPLEHRRAIGRALIAHAVLAAREVGLPAVTGATRDALVEQVTDELHGYGLGVGEFLMRPVKGLARSLVTCPGNSRRVCPV